MKLNKSFLITAMAVSIMASSVHARDQIRIVGSSTVFPFSAMSAELFSRQTGSKTPIVESTGTGGGFKLFCEGIGLGTPDITGASRPIKTSEKELCASNNVGNITEVLIGYDGIVMAESRNGIKLDLTLGEIYMALAATVPVNGVMVPNPFIRWSEINPALPNQEIRVYGPPPTSGTRDAFVELAMLEGAKEMGVDKLVSEDDFDNVAGMMRTDGRFVEAGENDNIIVQKLVADPIAVGIFGFSFLTENSDKVVGSRINGVEPNFENIADSSYPVSRSMFIYVKDQHKGVVPNLEEFVNFMLSESVSGEEGSLTDIGLIPVIENRESMRRPVK